jgi:hypothetical protein
MSNHAGPRGAMSTRTAAIAAAERGWHVFPCRPGDKRPAVDRWEQRACADPERVERYWPSGRHNVGVACGPSGLVVIDLDTSAHGGQLSENSCSEPSVRHGRDVLAALADRSGQPWPATYSVTTPSGGQHLYFAGARGPEIRNSAGRIGRMIDVRASGGYVLGAGSVIGGRVYVITDDRSVAALPGWLAELAEPSPAPRPIATPVAAGSLYGRLLGVVEAVLISEPGTRNGRLYWAACRAAEMVAAGQIERATAERVLLDAAIEAGLRGGEREARRTIASGLGTA